MKPVVIYMDKNASKVIMTKEEFEKYLKDAYEAGHSDGYAEGKAVGNWTINTPYYPTNTPFYYGSGTPSHEKPWEVTCCEAHNAVGE